MSEAPCCQKGLRALISRKLGRCPRCMRASAFGTLAGWATFAATYVVWPHPTLLALGLFVAVSFTLLLLAHLVAVMVRVASLHDAVHAGHSVSVPTEFSVGRRAMLLRLGRAALWTAAFGFGIFRTPRKAGAGAPPPTCERPAKHETKAVAGSNLGANRVCAANKKAAEAAALPLFAAPAGIFAKNFCFGFNSQTCPRCVVKSEDVDIDCTDTKIPCQIPGDGPGTFFDCTGVVTKVACRC